MIKALPVLCVAVIASAAVHGQTPTFRASVSAVRLDVLVTDGGHPVPGLQARDFAVVDNGVPQHVDLVSFDNLPLNVVIALDMSASVVGAKIAALRAAIRGVAPALTAQDRIAVLTFSGAVALRVGLTSGAADADLALDAPADAGETALVDASYAAIAVGQSAVGRALVMVCSDGDDTASVLSPGSVLATAKRADAVVYGLVPAGSDTKGFLRDLTGATGGRLISVDSSGRLGSRLLAVLDEFRHRYVLSYTPTGVAPEGWHRLEVGVPGRHAVVNARPGYTARSG